jgi:hypothetical protein
MEIIDIDACCYASTLTQGEEKVLWKFFGFFLLITSLTSEFAASFEIIESDSLSIPLYPVHKTNLDLIKTHSTDEVAWSLFCASNMPSKYDMPRYPPPTEVSANNLVVKADAPPAWKDTFKSFPLIGTYLNIMAEAQTYYATLENCVDFIAAGFGGKEESVLA